MNIYIILSSKKCRITFTEITVGTTYCFIPYSKTEFKLRCLCRKLYITEILEQITLQQKLKVIYFARTGKCYLQTKIITSTSS